MPRRKKIEAPVVETETQPKHRYKIKKIKAREVRDRSTGDTFVGEYDLVDLSLPDELQWIETFANEADAETELAARQASDQRTGR